MEEVEAVQAPEAVVHVMHDLPVSKCAPKKFRTTDLGCSVRISRRDDVVPKATWTWMEAPRSSSSKRPWRPWPCERLTRQTERDVAIGLTSLVKMCWTGSGRRLASSRKAKSRTTLAQIQARLRARKEARDRRQSLKRDEEIPETEEEVSDEDDEDWEDFGYASGYVVGGAERHGWPRSKNHRSGKG
eukprot:g6731.t1